MNTLSLAGLSKLLDERNQTPSKADELDRQIWQLCGADRAILVLDLSGFTRLTRKRGILHFLAVFRRAYHLVMPIVQAQHGRLVKAEADNVIATFPSASAAFLAATQMLQAAQTANQTLEDDEQSRLCIAIGYGHILELSDDFFGDEVNVTFKLGEDIAKAGELLITEAAMTHLCQEGLSPKVVRCEVETGGLSVPYFRIGEEPPIAEENYANNSR